jgi:hypothetical protein
MNLNSGNRSQGAAQTSNSLHLSTVANSKFGNKPWLNIESAGWLNIQSARTIDSLQRLFGKD